MRLSRRSILATVILIIVAAGGWFITHRRDTSPFTIPDRSLSGWTLVTSDGTDPWVVAARPPESLTAALLREASRRSGKSLIPPHHPGLPLVLRSEFEEGLQGVYGVDSVMRIAHETGVDSERFVPVCLAHHHSSGPSGDADLYFVAFESGVFNQMRLDLVPPQPEQAGVGIYDPATLTPILPVGATDDRFDRWWPLAFDASEDCVASLTAPAPRN